MVNQQERFVALRVQGINQAWADPQIKDISVKS